MDAQFVSYEYLVIVNTSRIPSRGAITCELIELSWIVVSNGSDSTSASSSKSGILDSKQCFILPTQSQVDLSDWPEMVTAEPFQRVIEKFEAYLNENFVLQNKSFCFVSDRVWDFQALRTLQAQTLPPPRPTFWNRIFNLRLEFARKFGIRPENMKEMQTHLKLSQIPIFNALDECKSQEMIISKMLSERYLLMSPETLVDRQRSTIGVWEMASSTLRISGISMDVKKATIIDFFIGLNLKPNNIIITTSRTGRPNGYAYVQFVSSTEASSACSRNGSIIGQNVVNITYACKSDFEKAQYRQMAINNELFGDVENLTSQQTDSIAEPAETQFSSYQSQWTGMFIQKNENNNTFSFGENLQADNGSVIRTLPNTSQLADSFLTIANHLSSQSNSNVASQTPHMKTGSLSDVRSQFPQAAIVMLKGLPYSATEEQTKEFLKGYEFYPQSITISLGDDGRPSGDGFVAFAAPIEAQRFVNTKNGHYMGSRYIELSLIPYQS